MNSGTLSFGEILVFENWRKMRDENSSEGRGRLFLGYEKNRRLFPILQQFAQINSVEQIIKMLTEIFTLFSLNFFFWR